MKILDINQEYLNKLNLNILHSLISKEKTDAINKQKEHLKDIKKQKKELIKKVEKEEQSGETVLLKDNLNVILMNFDMNFSDEGRNIL